MKTTVNLAGYPSIWETGAEIIDVLMSLGQGEKSSNCTITLADPSHAIAADLIRHSLSQGGIVALPDSQQQQTEGGIVPPGFVSSGSTASSTLTPLRQAFLDVIASSEGTYKEPDNGYKTIVGYSHFESYADHPKVYVASANSTAAGRYQFLDSTWAGLKTKLKLPDFSPASQDKGALELIREKGALSSVDSGNFEAAVTACRKIWASFPGAGYGQGENSMAELKAFYNQRLVALGMAPGLPQTTKEQPKTTPDTTKTTDVTEDAQEVVKGNKLTITVGDQAFEFFHQGTEALHDGKTSLTGQGIRYVLNRRKRNKTVGQTSLKQLATAIALAHKVKLDYQPTFDFFYSHIDQTGISDYQLLLRECQRVGLFVSEASGVLTIKTLQDLKDSQLVLAEGHNLLSWSIKDEALDSSNEVAGSPYLQDESKVSLNPITGQFEQSKPDIDPVKDVSVTGKAAKGSIGILEPGQEASADQLRSRVKRVKGLPSTFTIPLDVYSLQLEPLMAVRTEGLSGSLSRVWLVDNVKHSLVSGKTELGCYSPIEVLDTTPQTPSSPSTPTTVTPSTGWIMPLKGFVTSCYKPPNRPDHHGVDISSVGGSGAGGDVIASASGIVVFSGFGANSNGHNGYGFVIDIKHPNGWLTRYAHLHTLKVRLGETVAQGQLIGIEGSTGHSGGTHLHFEIRKPGGASINPATLGLSQLGIKGAKV